LHIFASHAPPPTHTHALSLHDALPICAASATARSDGCVAMQAGDPPRIAWRRLSPFSAAQPLPGLRLLHGANSSSRKYGQRNKRDRKSTRLNSSHLGISYAVFCLKKKK